MQRIYEKPSEFTAAALIEAEALALGLFTSEAAQQLDRGERAVSSHILLRSCWPSARLTSPAWPR